MSEEQFLEIKKRAQEALRQAELAVHEYAAACKLGDERIFAFEVYERVRNATRRT